MKKSLLVLAVLSAFAPVLAQAEAGDIVVRLRAAYVNPDEKSKLGTTVATTALAGTVLPGGVLTVDNNTIPELDISYYVTKNIAVELILATGTRHDVSIAKNTGTLGNQNLDFGTSGVHSSCVSLYHFLKYYFCHILSLENLSGDAQMWRSGLSGNGSTVNISYQATFDTLGNTANVESISPVIFCRSTKVLSIHDGHIINVV